MQLGAAATLALVACAAAPCDRDVKAGKWHEASVSCRVAYRNTPTPKVANHLMRALFYDNQGDEAARLAATLLSGEYAARAHQVLGNLARRKGDGRSAAIHLGMAVSLDAVRGDQSELARDAFALAGAHRQTGELAAAMAAAVLCRDAAIRANDHQMAMYAEVGRGDILRYTGDLAAAERVLTAARALATGPGDRALADFKLGILYISAGNDVFAASHLSSAASLSVGRAEMAMFRPAIELNLAWLARRAGRLDEATTHLDAAEVGGGADRAASLTIRGDVELDRGASDRAAELLASAEAADPQGDYRWYVPYRRGVVEERRGSLDAAENAYRRSIAAVEDLRAGSGAYEGQVIEGYRVPYHRLIGLLAPRGLWRDVLEVVSRLDAGAMITAEAGSGDVAPGADSGGQALHRPGARSAAPPSPAGSLGADRLLAAWRGRHLLVIVSGGEQMWQLDISDGEVTGRAVGTVAAIEALAARLDERPDDAEAARGLADALLPQRPGRDPLALLLVGPVARAPLAALRGREGGRVLSRVLGLRRRVGGPFGTGPALVIGDSRGDLPAAASEARWVAGRLRARLRLGPEATRAALANGGGAALLHLAVHGELREDAPVLLLADGEWTPADVAQLYPAPRTVVLASCASAAARDEGGWSSFAAAFLAAGTETVVTTQWSVTDEDSAALVRAFYERGGATSPAAALAAAQADLARTRPARAWAAFTVVAAPPIVP